MATKLKPKKPAVKKAVSKTVPKKKVVSKVITKAGKSVAESARKRELFKQAFLANGGNKTQSAITAGFSVKTAGQAGNRLFKYVKDEIEAAHAAVSAKMGLSLERTLQEIARVAYADPRKLFHEDGRLKQINELDDDTAAVISSIEVDVLREDRKAIGTTTSIKQWDKNAALEKAMKFHGAYEKDNKQRSPVVMIVSPIDENI